MLTYSLISPLADLENQGSQIAPDDVKHVHAFLGA